MKRATLVVAAVAMLTAGCGAMRAPIDGAQYPMMYTNGEPEAGEGCAEVMKKTCPYFSNPMKSAAQNCAEKFRDEAAGVSANLIAVNEPKASVGGFATRSPIATMYKCDNLKQE